MLMFYKDHNYELYYEKSFTILKSIDGCFQYPFIKYNLDSKKNIDCKKVIFDLLNLVESYHQKGKVIGNLNLHTIWFYQDQLIYVGKCIGETKSRYCEKEYSSPEMISRMRLPYSDIFIDHYSDIYAIGKILNYFNQRFHLKIDAIIQKCTKLIKIERYPSVKAIKAALKKQTCLVTINQKSKVVASIKKEDFKSNHHQIYYQDMMIFENENESLVEKIYQAILFEIEYSDQRNCHINCDKIIHYYTGKIIE